jgi:hypothetical protein
MPKAEISWKRVDAEGTKFQVYAQHVGREWIFYIRQRRYDQWQPLKHPPLEDWLALLDAIERGVPRRRYPPDEAALVRKRIREIFPEAEF